MLPGQELYTRRNPPHPAAPQVAGLAALGAWLGRRLVASGFLPRGIGRRPDHGRAAANPGRATCHEPITKPSRIACNTISDQILSRSRLERIITDFESVPRAACQGIMEDVVQRMRADIKVKVEGKESFRVSYVSDDGQDRSEGHRTAGVPLHRRELRDQRESRREHQPVPRIPARGRERRLLEHEKKLEDYQGRHAGQLPIAAQAQSAGDSERPVAAAVDQRIHQPRARAAHSHRAAARGRADASGASSRPSDGPASPPGSACRV